MSSRSIRRLIPMALAIIAWSACAPSGADRVDGRYYPGSGDAWGHRAPAEVGMAAALGEQGVDSVRSPASPGVPYAYAGDDEYHDCRKGVKQEGDICLE